MADKVVEHPLHQAIHAGAHVASHKVVHKLTPEPVSEYQYAGVLNAWKNKTNYDNIILVDYNSVRKYSCLFNLTDRKGDQHFFLYLDKKHHLHINFIN